jgi:hypothetical protein
MKSDDEIIEDLKRLTEGLLFMSESEYPFEIIYWKGLTQVSEQSLPGLTGAALDSAVETVSVEEFFRVATSAESWRADEGREGAQKYLELVEALKGNLSDLTVYRVGTINISVYVVGRAPSGNWLGLSTRVVET